ncbi:MAG TPA: invasion associated locus B family protein [Aliidongia sp.]|nr:invasion associated locus B family protein [Aliidongia sp.]
MSSFKLRVILAVGLLVVGGVGFEAYRMTAAAKDTTKAPAKTTAAPGDAAKSDPTDKAALWGKSCDTGADGKQTCVVIQNVVITDKSKNASLRALSVAVGYLPGQTSLGMALTLPLGIKLPTGVGFQIDDGQANTLQVETCLADGCRTFMTIDAGGRDSLIKSKLVRVSYELANGQKMGLPIELAGFGEALAQLSPNP